ncbi:MAG TPA: hypothetical protein V6D46_03920 [Coleofasciculaceae cyanobacterium]
MIDPLFWLGLSFLLVSICLAIALAAAIPALQELGRAARSAEKLFDTLARELPPTLEAIRLTGLEISDLTDDMSSGVQSAGQVVQKVDSSLDSARRQVRRVGTTARRAAAGVQAAWQGLLKPNRDRRRLDARGEGRAELRAEATGRRSERYGLPSGQEWEDPDRYSEAYLDENLDDNFDGNGSADLTEADALDSLGDVADDDRHYGQRTDDYLSRAEDDDDEYEYDYAGEGPSLKPADDAAELGNDRVVFDPRD